MTSVEIETERLRLCEPCDRHVASLPGVLNDPEIAANTLTTPHPYTLADAAQAVERFATAHASNTGFIRFIELRQTGTLIGSIGLEFHDDRTRGELGYAIGREWWGQGYATEASRAMVDHGFRALGLQRITAHAMLRNPASSRVLQKLHFEGVGVICGACRKEGRDIDADGYVMTREQWSERHRAHA